MFFGFRTKRFVRKHFKYIPEATAVKWVTRLRALYIFSAWNLALIAGYLVIKGGKNNSSEENEMGLIQPKGNVVTIRFKGLDGYEIERTSEDLPSEPRQ